MRMCLTASVQGSWLLTESVDRPLGAGLLSGTLLALAVTKGIFQASFMISTKNREKENNE